MRPGLTPARGNAVNAPPVRVRDAYGRERERLEELQRRASDIWPQSRAQLAAAPDAIELPAQFIGDGWVRVAAGIDDHPVGFSVTIPLNGGVDELDGLFVEPDQMRRGVGTMLLVNYCCVVGCRRSGQRGWLTGRTSLPVVGAVMSNATNPVPGEAICRKPGRFRCRLRRIPSGADDLSRPAGAQGTARTRPLACRRARAGGAAVLEVMIGPAQPFYEKLGFRVIAPVNSRFGPAVRMRIELTSIRLPGVDP